MLKLDFFLGFRHRGWASKRTRRAAGPGEGSRCCATEGKELVRATETDKSCSELCGLDREIINGRREGERTCRQSWTSFPSKKLEAPTAPFHSLRQPAARLGVWHVRAAPSAFLLLPSSTCCINRSWPQRDQGHGCPRG